MSGDRRLLTADLWSLASASGYRLTSYGGQLGGEQHMNLTDPATGETYKLMAPRHEELSRTLLGWLASREQVPTWAEVQTAMLARALTTIEQQREHMQGVQRQLVELVSGVLARELREEPTLPPAVRVWDFGRAPRSFQELSTNGGDEDWVALVPPGYSLPTELDSSWRSVDAHPLPDGSTVYIGSHA